MYGRILLAYDGSMEGRTALREGALLAKRYHAQVFLLSVITEGAGTAMGEGVGGGGVTQQQEGYQELLRDGLARLKQAGFGDAVAKLAIGEPAQQIGAYARQIAADLVVVGHRRQSAFGRWWSGPSGAYLVDHIHCSLLVCRNVLSDEAFQAALAESEQAAGLPPRPAPATQDSPAPPQVASRLPRRRLRRVLFALLPLVLIVAIVLYVTGGKVVSTDDAYVEAETVGISTDISGIVRSIDVTDNQHVVRGQLLVQLDDLQFRYALNHAVAQVGTVRNELEALQANYRNMQAQVSQAQTDVSYNVTQFNRAQHLLGVHFVSKSAFDSAQRSLRNAHQKLASLKQQLAAIAANLNGDPDGPVNDNPRYLSAVAQRDEAARELAHTVIRAPFAGIVTQVPTLSPGKYLPASTTVFYLVDTDHVWVDADPKETQLTYVRPGQPVTVRVDTYPDTHWSGTVESISPAAAQQFALLPAQNTSGNWVKVVQRIPLRVRVDTSDSSRPPLRAGMSVEVDIDSGHARGWPHFLTALFGHSRRRR